MTPADERVPSTAPKPFVFVLMPFDAKFNDIYKFGIKGAAEEAGAYAERIDEQIFTEGILERVFNQINKADVVVADMTGRNPNVFYEVGYAHALGKLVLLLTQDADDIPFDLKHHQHTVYSGKIETLRNELTPKISWAIAESRKREVVVSPPPYEVSIAHVSIPEGLNAAPPLVFRFAAGSSVDFLEWTVRNNSGEVSRHVSHIYLFAQEHSAFDFYYLVPGGRGRVGGLAHVKAHPSDSVDGLVRQYRLKDEIPMLPPGALETLKLGVAVTQNILAEEGAETFRLRIHTDCRICDYSFTLAFQKNSTP